MCAVIRPWGEEQSPKKTNNQAHRSLGTTRVTALVSFRLDDRGALIASLVCLSPHFTVGSFHSVCPIDEFRMWSLSQIVDVPSVLSPSLPDRTAA